MANNGPECAIIPRCTDDDSVDVGSDADHETKLNLYRVLAKESGMSTDQIKKILNSLTKIVVAEMKKDKQRRLNDSKAQDLRRCKFKIDERLTRPKNFKGLTKKNTKAKQFEIPGVVKFRTKMQSAQKAVEKEIHGNIMKIPAKCAHTTIVVTSCWQLIKEIAQLLQIEPRRAKSMIVVTPCRQLIEEIGKD